MRSNYYQHLRWAIQERRNQLMDILESLGFVCFKPQGAYYLMANIGRFGFASDRDFVTFLIRDIGVATVPGRCFYSDQADGQSFVRFCFGKAEATLTAAEQRLTKLADALDHFSVARQTRRLS
jgi:aminotransferase